ncbi:MAG: hypothetical protein ABI641_04890 [Caldimonas sp.]
MHRPALAALLACVLALLLSCASDTPADSSPQRNFPQKALRGDLTFGITPEVRLNGRPARLAPGARIHDANNMTVVPGGLTGGRFLVHYTTDLYGLVHDVWILTPSEAAREPWPTTPEEAQKWIFSPSAQAWAKP